MRKLGYIILLCLLLTAGGCKKEASASLRELGGALLGDLLKDLASPESMVQLLALDGKEARLDFVLDKAKSRLDMLGVQCRGAIESGDPAVLRGWVNDTLPLLAPLLDKYTPEQLLRAINKVDPRLERTLRAAIPKALAYLADRPAIPEQGIYPISEPTLEGLVQAWSANLDSKGLTISQGLEITDAELVLFGEMLTREWQAAARIDLEVVR